MQTTSTGEDILTVQELIDLLRKQPPDAHVYHEGCDCFGFANGVELDTSDNTVLITRSN